MNRVEKKGNIESFMSPFKAAKAEMLYADDYVIEVGSKAVEGGTEINGLTASESYGEYKVKIFLDKGGRMISCSCSCDEFEDRHKPCEHIGACYLKYINEMDLEPSKLDDILRAFEYSIHEGGNKDILRLQINLVHSSSRAVHNFLELKAGTGRMHNVKNVSYFLNAYERVECTQLGREILDFNNVQIEPLDRQLLDYFIELQEIDNTLLSSRNSDIHLIDDKRIYILDSHMDRLMSMFKGRKIQVDLPIGKYDDVMVNEGSLNIDFVLKRDGDGLRLGFKGASIPFPMTGKGDYYFYDGAIWPVTKEYQGSFMYLFDEMIRNPKGVLDIRENEKDKFASFLMPKLRKIGHLSIDGALKKEFIEEDFTAEFYIDKDREGLILSIYFIYGDDRINPLKESRRSSSGILIRKVMEEKAVIDKAEGYGFKSIDEEFRLEDEEKAVDFIIDGINELRNIGDVYYSQSFKSMKISTTKHVKIRVRLNHDDMLSMSFDFQDIPKNEIADLIRAFNENKRYYKLKDNGIVLLEGNAISNLGALQNYQDFDDDYFEKEEIEFPKYLAPYINEKFISEESFKRDRGFRELINNIREAGDMEYDVPKCINGTLRDYQVKGFQWMKTLSSCGFGGILADEMGLGKTLQSITFIASLDKGPSLIVCPTSLTYNWKDEIEKFAGKLKAAVMSGNPEERKRELSNIEGYDVVIASYNIIVRDIEQYEKIFFESIIIDEGQNMKNPLSQRARAVKKLNGKNKFVLTGTPIENALTEMWSIFDFIMPGYLLNRKKFQMKYEVPIVKDKDEKALIELKERIRPFILRRLKKDVLEELPPKIEKTISVDMSPEQKDIYVSYVRMFKDEIDSIDVSKENGKMKIFAALTRLRQICCHPGSFLMDYTGDSGKFEALYDILDSSVEEGHRILVFSQFTSVLSMIGRGLKNRGITFSYLDGSISAEDRMHIVKKFNSGNDSVFLISLKAGGAGLNLTSADIVIHFDPWWNPAVEDQATDRAHRIGQKNTVEVIKLVAKGTIEEKVIKLQEAKKEIIKEVIGDEEIGDTTLSSMSMDELQNLFVLD